MLKNVNNLLQRAGDTSVNSKNRDEVIAAISCYGKLLTSKSQKNVSKIFLIIFHKIECT